jgi:hypothetical protein
MARKRRSTLLKSSIVLALGLAVVLAVVSSGSGLKLSSETSVSSNLRVSGSYTLSSLLTTYCLNSTYTTVQNHTLTVGHLEYNEFGFYYGPKNASSPSACTHSRWGVVQEVFNESHGGALEDEMFSDYSILNSTTEFLTSAPILGTALPGIEEWQIFHSGGTINVSYCPSQVCGGAPPAGSPSGPSGSPCSISWYYSSGVLGWGVYINQCGWGYLYSTVCSASWNGWSVGFLLAIFAIVFGGNVGAAGAVAYGLTCALMWAFSQVPAGGSILGYTGPSCWWSWTAWSWICTTYTVFYGVWVGTPPPGF